MDANNGQLCHLKWNKILVVSSWSKVSKDDKEGDESFCVSKAKSVGLLKWSQAFVCQKQRRLIKWYQAFVCQKPREMIIGLEKLLCVKS